jgi:hypothetical protein
MDDPSDLVTSLRILEQRLAATLADVQARLLALERRLTLDEGAVETEPRVGPPRDETEVSTGPPDAVGASEE